ncbi:multidrug ABC transporter [Caulobacter sp. Root1455]|uniref:MFS transporter n=1 Tax=Caulobacter sp. Root1455 TaxID=1736465 RepID=UPI0006F38D71|nr:MFS transporter [Caulobacter sp. Root1455]KQZ00028.1 multidrug ABC transporter [Caulobacter sp. Root1455]
MTGRGRSTLAIASVLTALMLVVLDASIVNVALPTLARDLRVSPAAAVLVVTAYQTGLVMALLPCAALGESLGHRRVFIGGVALFTVASGLCAIAPNLAWLVVARLAQGLGAAAVMSLGVALLRTVVPAHRLGVAIGWNALVVALTSAAGPTVGALVLSLASWPWLFAINLPLGFLVLAAANALPLAPGSARRLERVSLALSMSAFGLLIVGAEMIVKAPAIAVVAFAGGVLGLTTLIRREASHAAPLLPLDLLRAPSFRRSVIASACCFIGQGAGLIALPFYLQHGLGLSPLEAGLYITPWPLMAAVSATLAGRMAKPSTTALLCATGCALLSAGLLAASAWPLAEAPVTIVPIVMLCGLGFGLFQVTNNRNMFLSAPMERSGAAGGLQSMARLTGQTAGVVVMTLLFSRLTLDAAPRIGLAIGALLTLAAGLLSTLHKTEREAHPA